MGNGCFPHRNDSLVMAECTCASLIFTSFNDVPSLICVVPNPKYLNWSTSSNTSIHPYLYIGGWPWLDAVDDDFAFVGADFHAVISSCFIQPFS